MYANQLKNLVKSDRKILKIFGAILPKDKLPKSKPLRNIAYIVNTDRTGGKGKHWLLLYCVVGGDSSLVYFVDPLGNPPHHYNSHLSTFCSKFQKIITLSHPIQDRDSQLCGLFVMYFLHHLARGHHLKSVERHFYDKNLKRNDRLVFRFCWKMFGRKCTAPALLFKSLHHSMK